MGISENISILLNHLYDGERSGHKPHPLNLLLNHLYDGEHTKPTNSPAPDLLNHLYDGEQILLWMVL